MPNFVEIRQLGGIRITRALTSVAVYSKGKSSKTVRCVGAEMLGKDASVTGLVKFWKLFYRRGWEFP